MARNEYSTAVEGGAPVQVRYAITGRIDPATYLPFVLNRARWLAINGWASAEQGAATVVAAGPEALVGALEMACTLGPWDALVEEIAVQDEPGDGGAWLRLRSKASSPAGCASAHRATAPRRRGEGCAAASSVSPLHLGRSGRPPA